MILNLTQHAATAEQQQAGVVDLPPNAMAWIRMALTFGSIPSNESLAKRAEAIADFAVEQGLLSGAFDEELGFGQAMIGGLQPVVFGGQQQVSYQGLRIFSPSPVARGLR